jgi:nucleoside-diphosphate-sugar epimerase
MKVLVTGASGRLAEYVVKELRGRYDIVLASRKPLPEDRADLPWVQTDLNNYEDCLRAMEGIDAVQALGAVPYPTDHPTLREQRIKAGQEMPPFDTTMKTNTMGIYYMMMAAVKQGVKTVVMTGSNCAYGMGFRVTQRPFPIKYLPLDEVHPSDIEDSYSYTKLAGEELLHMFTRAYGIRTYITRPAMICNEARRKQLAENAKPLNEWRDYMAGWVASEDVATQQRLILDKAEQLSPHEVFVANGLESTLLEPSMEYVAKYRPDLVPVTKLSGFQAFFSMEKSKKLLNWQPQFNWRDYLKK